MAFTDALIQGRVISGLGSVSSNTIKGDNSTSYKHGSLLRKLTDGTAVPCANGAAAGCHLIYLGPDLSAATAGFITVGEITEDTVFEAQLHAAAGATATPAQAQIGDRYDIKVQSQIWGVDVEESGNDFFEVTQIYPNEYDYDTSGNGAGVFGLVHCKVIASEINKAPAGS